MRRLSFLLGFFLVTSGVIAQNGKIEGKVTDSKSGAVLSGVSISVNGDKTIASTGVDGYFVINLEAGKNTPSH